MPVTTEAMAVPMAPTARPRAAKMPANLPPSRGGGDDPHAGLRQPERHRAAQPATAARHDRDAAGKAVSVAPAHRFSACICGAA